MTAEDSNKKKQSRVSQSDIPSYSLSEALKVARTISDEFARQPAKPLHLAQGLNIKPGSSTFRMLTGAAVAYGLTTGAYNSSEIGLTDLGKKCVAPTYDGEDAKAMRDALLKPRVLSEFLTKYNGTKFPSDNIGANVLIDMGIVADRAASVLSMIKASATEYGLTKDIKGEIYVDIDQPVSNQNSLNELDPMEPEEIREDLESSESTDRNEPGKLKQNVVNKVFVTHGKNKDIANQLKELLVFGKFEPVLAIDHETTAKPVPQKVLDDMRSCSAAVIHVGPELNFMDSEGTHVKTLNQNVLIEIGAAMALYGQKFILLVEKGTELPSNLQGLYEVRYEGEKLDYEATMKLLKAFNDFMS
jgi:predicted nucleotide-binding protein